MSKVTDITDENFDDIVLKSDKVTLVDFWATWCGPCRKLSPVIENLAEKLSSDVNFVKIKADENVTTAQKYSIIGVPCLLIFKNGEPVERIVNVVSSSVIENSLRKHL